MVIIPNWSIPASTLCRHGMACLYISTHPICSPSRMFRESSGQSEDCIRIELLELRLEVDILLTDVHLGLSVKLGMTPSPTAVGDINARSTSAL